MKASHLSLLGITLFDIWFPPGRPLPHQAAGEPAPAPAPRWMLWRWTAIVTHMQAVIPPDPPGSRPYTHLP